MVRPLASRVLSLVVARTFPPGPPESTTTGARLSRRMADAAERPQAHHATALPKLQAASDEPAAAMTVMIRRSFETRSIMDRQTTSDCLIVGGGPAGLTAAVYLARFRRNVVLVDSGTSRTRLIRKSHN